MGSSERRKGRAYEQEIARWYKDAGFPDAYRGFQSRGGGKEEADVVVPGLPLHIECKHIKNADGIPAAYRQAVADADDGKIPVVHYHVTRGPSLVVLGLDDWSRVLRVMNFVEVPNG